MSQLLYLIFFILEILILYYLSKSVFKKLSQKIFKLTKKKNLTIYLIALIFIIGTFIHEMSHFLFSLALLVPVGNLDLIPKIEENGVKMGSVQIAKTDIIRRNLIGIAPFVIGLSLIIFVLQSNINKFIIGLLVFEIGNTMFSSKKDLESLLPLLIFLCLIILIAAFVGVRVDLLKILLNPNIKDIFQKISELFLIPIVIDSTLLIMLY